MKSGIQHLERSRVILDRMIIDFANEDIPKPKSTYYTMRFLSFFYNYPNLRNITKILFGILFLLTPILLSIIIMKLNLQDENFKHNFAHSIIPLAVGMIFIFAFLIFIIIIKFCACTGRMVCAPWHRELTGVLIQTFIFLLGLVFTIIELNQCLVYFDTIKNNLIKNFNSTPLVKSLLLTLMFYDKTPKQDLIYTYDFDFFENKSLVSFQPFKSFLKPLQKFHFTKILKPGKVYESDLYSSNIIYEFVLNIYFPILFISFVSLFKIFFFKTKNSIIKIIFHLLIIFEYFVFKYSDCDKNSRYLCILIPVIGILFCYFLLKVIDLVRNISKSKNVIDKTFFIIFDTITISGILFVGNSIIMCCKDFNYSGLVQIRFFLLGGILMIVFGNCLQFGELFIEYFLFDSVRKEYLPVEAKEYYHESYRNYAKYEFQDDVKKDNKDIITFFNDTSVYKISYNT